jgi:hypothetical protein
MTAFMNEPLRCQYCGNSPSHSAEMCPLVKSIEYYPNGNIKRVEKVQPVVSAFEQIFGRNP